MRLFAAVVVLFAVIAPAAGGEIDEAATLTPSGLGELRVGISEARAEAIVGRRIKLQELNGPDCQSARLPRKTFAIFSFGKLRRVTLTSDHWATKSGIRVGDPESVIADEYGDRAKRSQHAYTDGSYYKVKRGNRKFVFETGEDGTITAIHGGARPEVDYIESCA